MKFVATNGAGTTRSADLIDGTWYLHEVTDWWQEDAVDEHYEKPNDGTFDAIDWVLGVLTHEDYVRSKHRIGGGA
jgi:hypothetical protein